MYGPLTPIPGLTYTPESDQPHDIETELKNAQHKIAAYRDLITEILTAFTITGHPGEPCLSSGWVREATVTAWHARAGLTYTPEQP